MDTVSQAPKFPQQLSLTNNVIAWLKEIVPYHTHEIYDNPFGVGASQEGLDFIHDEIHNLKELATALDLDFDEIVQKETSSYERARMELILESRTWDDELLEDIEDLDV